MNNMDVSSLPSILGGNRIEEMSRKELSKNPLAHRSSYENYFIKKNLNEVERAVYLLKEGDEVQKNAVYRYLPSLFKTPTLKEAVNLILEKQIMENLWKLQEEEQICVGKALIPVLRLLPRKQIGTMFDFFVSMLNVKNEKVSQVWEDVFYTAVPFMPQSKLKGELLEFVKEKGSQFETERNRAFSGKFLGVLCKPLSAGLIEKELLALIVNMCQDTSYTVRKYMAHNLTVIARRLGPEKTRELLAGELFQLLDDETKEVKIVAFLSTVDLLDFFGKKFRKTKVLPIFVKLVEEPPHDLFPYIVQQIGPILTRLSGDIIYNDVTMTLFSNFFSMCCEHKDAKIRESCAFNFPAVLQGLGWKSFVARRGKLFRNYSMLASDGKSDEIRFRIACSVHIIAQLLAKEHQSNVAALLSEIYVGLLKDEKQEVRVKAFSNFAIVVDAFFELPHKVFASVDEFVRWRRLNPKTKKPVAKVRKQVGDVFTQKIIAYHETLVQRQWRKLTSLFLNLEWSCEFFPRDVLAHQFIPMARKYIVNSSVRLKEQSCKVLVVMSRALEHSGLQIQLFKSLCSELGNGKSFWQRIAFLEIVSHVLECYSRRFFKTHLIEHVIKLAEDKVSEVKRKFCSVMPQLKRSLSPSSDVKYIAILKERSSFLVLDKDASVIAAANKANEEIAQIDKEVLRGIANPMSFHNRDNVRDREKEMMERKWDMESGEDTKKNEKKTIKRSGSKERGVKKKRKGGKKRKIKRKGKKKRGT